MQLTRLLTASLLLFPPSVPAAPCVPERWYWIEWIPTRPIPFWNSTGIWQVDLDHQYGKVPNGGLVLPYGYENGKTSASDWKLSLGPSTAIETYDNKCLDAGLHPAQGTQLKVWQCLGHVPQQTWDIFDTQDQSQRDSVQYRAKVKLSGTNLCTDVTGGDTYKPMQLWHCGDHNLNQVFLFHLEKSYSSS